MLNLLVSVKMINGYRYSKLDNVKEMILNMGIMQKNGKNIKEKFQDKLKIIRFKS